MATIHCEDRKCIVCGRTFEAGRTWHNWSICSPACCDARREQLDPAKERYDDDGYYLGRYRSTGERVS